MYYHDSIFTFLPVFTTLFALIQIVLYLIDSFALHRMAGNTGMKNPWIAWIPFAKDYLLGSLADRYNDTIREKKTRFHLWLTLLSAAQAPLATVSIMVFGAGSFSDCLCPADNHAACSACYSVYCGSRITLSGLLFNYLLLCHYGF